MIEWTSAELDKIGKAEELRIAPLREDGTLRKPVTIWVVRLGNELYVRSAYGQSSAWYRGGQVRLAGRIWAGGVEKDVSFVDVDPGRNDRIDAAYRAKYGHYQPVYFDPIVSPEARAATIQLVPR